MRQTFINTRGVLQVIIGKTAVDYNPSFRLYLSSSQPLFMTGEGLYPLPFSKVCTISMAVSREGICNMLLADTLRLERPEFEGQLRSVESDVGLHKQQIFHAKVTLSFSWFIRSAAFQFDLELRAKIEAVQTPDIGFRKKETANERDNLPLIIAYHQFCRLLESKAMKFVVNSKIGSFVALPLWLRARET